ncbi:transposase [Salmonella enterica]
MQDNRKRHSPGEPLPVVYQSETSLYCGYRMLEMPLHQRIRPCPEYGVEHNRDINAALNIRSKGLP